MKKSLFFSVFLCLFQSAVAQEVPTQEQLIFQVNQLVILNSESLKSEEINLLADKILPNRQHYSNDVIAALFLLLSNVEFNQGNVENAYQYVLKGLDISTQNKDIKVCLTLKLAQLYIAKKQYAKLLDVSQRAVFESKKIGNEKNKLLSLSYRSVALATLGKHKQAFSDLQEVEKGITENKLFSDHIEIFTILAAAYFQLSDYQTALTLQLNILKLRFDLNQKNNIEKTYLSLGYAYFYLLRFDDAFNAFWEASYHAEQKSAIISVGYAKKGIGLSLLKQKQYAASAIEFQKAADIFEKENLKNELIETYVALANININADQKQQGYLLLKKVLVLLDGEGISLKYTGFYRMLANMYFEQKDYQKAYFWQEKHSQLLLVKVNNKKIAVNTAHQFYNQSLSILQGEKSITQSRELAIKLAEDNELSNTYADKSRYQKIIINSLLAFVILQFVTIFSFIMKLRTKKRALAYGEQKESSYVLASTMKTKHDYQLAFKKARIYKYSLTVSYFVIENWQELSFLCSKKVLKEIKRDIATVFNEQLTEFDQGGLLNDGEYLLLFEHQNEQEVNDKVENLAQALRVRFFANLGDFSVTINYGLQKPDFKDIDPYVFLARLCESVTSTKTIAK